MRNSNPVFLGKVQVGGGAPVSIQSMTNTDTRDAEKTLAQIRRLAAAGCEIIRCAVPDAAAAAALERIASESPVPVVADIHFDHRLALASIASGVAGIRLNPGNLANADAVAMVARAALEAGIPIRVGSNSGSVRRETLQQMKQNFGGDDCRAMAEALFADVKRQCALLEKAGFRDVKISLKSSDVPSTVLAYRLAAERTAYPLHVGVTEAGTPERGVVKSAVGIGALLLDGIGDTIRVSLTGDPEEEVIAARRILESCGLRSASPEIVSCPTCGRTQIDLVSLARRVESLVAELKTKHGALPLRKIAVMGCVVNGPGEARDADWGLAGGNHCVVLFRKGEKVGTYSEEEGFLRLRQALEDSCVR